MNYIIIDGRSVCDKNCGYDKAKTSSVQTPCQYKDFKQVLDDVTTFKPHKHPTTVSHRIIQNSLKEAVND